MIPYFTSCDQRFSNHILLRIRKEKTVIRTIHFTWKNNVTNSYPIFYFQKYPEYCRRIRKGPRTRPKWSAPRLGWVFACSQCKEHSRAHMFFTSFMFLVVIPFANWLVIWVHVQKCLRIVLLSFQLIVIVMHV